MRLKSNDRDVVRRLNWFGGPAESLASMLVAGALVWGSYSALQIAFNGVVLDESVLPGQIIADAVAYPAGHPHDVFYRQAYSLSHFLAAGMWRVGFDEIAISAVRNWFFLLTSIVAVFSVALVLTRRPYWAHAAVAATLLGGYLRFAGTYPLWVFPDYYSNGHIGLQLAVICCAVLAGGLWRTGGVLLGIMPAIHATLSLAAWPWAFLYLGAVRVHARPNARKRFLPAFGVGLAVSVLLAVVIVVLPQPRAAVSPYVSDIDNESVRENYIALTDPHRQPLPVHTLGYLLNPAAFISLSMLLWTFAGAPATKEGRRGDSTAVAGLIAVGGIAWAAVYGTWAVQQIFGRFPDVVLTAMPWRFSNVSAILLVPFTVAAIVWVARGMSEREAPMVRLMVAAIVLGAGIVASPIVPQVGRDLVGSNILVALWGVLIAGALWEARRLQSVRMPTLLAAAILIGAAAAFVAYTGIVVYMAFVAGATVTVLLIGKRVPPASRLRWVLNPLLALGIALSSIAAIPDRSALSWAPGQLRWDIFSEDDRRVAQWLADNASPEDLVLVAYYYPRAELQTKSGQPVLLELETLQIMTYMPHLAPVIGTMVLDLYGVDYRESAALLDECRPGLLSPWCDVWSRRWQERTAAEWRDLAEKYEFRLVWAPSEPGLDLEPVLRGENSTMYAIGEH